MIRVVQNRLHRRAGLALIGMEAPVLRLRA
jgi:hypothetical protein